MRAEGISGQMRIGIVGRTEILFETAERLRASGHQIVHIITAREAPEYTRTSEDFKELADEWSVPYSHSARIYEVLPLIKQTAPDIGVSLNYPGIIPQTVIDAYRLGILNAHAGDLPRYRGNACPAWAILNGEDRVGLCVHKMVGGELDSGDIITRDYFPITLDTKVTNVMDWMGQRIPDLFREAVTELGSDPEFILERQSDRPENALRCYPRRPEDGRIDWRRGAVQILRLINASNKPYSGAFCEFEGQRMTIWDAELVEDEEIFCAVPGQVTQIGEGHIDVAAGDGKLRLTNVELSEVSGSPARWVRSIRQRLS